MEHAFRTGARLFAGAFCTMAAVTAVSYRPLSLVVSSALPESTRVDRSLHADASTAGGGQRVFTTGGAHPEFQTGVLLYQYSSCPFCNKVKAYLDWRQIAYTAVEVNPLTKTELKWSVDYTKVPIVIAMPAYERLIESSKIIETLEVRMTGNDDFLRDSESEKWRAWVDTSLVKTLPPNIYRTIPEAWDSLEYMTEHHKFSAMERRAAQVVGTVVMYVIGKMLKRKYGFADERQALVDRLNEWSEFVDSRGGFAGGKQPNVTDASVFGVLRAVEPLQLWPEVTSKSRISKWYRNMKEHVGPSQCKIVL
ncbi:mitochondrial thioredoxin (TRX)-like/glutathione S-transferase (GST C) family protein [Andalucia godoyi]|uniref:Prostaglandin E synthase 2 n=1 Tax=Andalucia godoyi TaxID=505711 RepID=A0A8K0AJ44_ANDGO|nr:mitochondrial thioredoxin (TRX)-like/glutathione S-transferase (GST C) family protein [Andalucia godoyi]|eukprot:ANDGO_08299.mRNA.1 mitochondrial thioredoxin (TRX)-like/glutathione S-transferase (GST C) family protein